MVGAKPLGANQGSNTCLCSFYDRKASLEQWFLQQKHNSKGAKMWVNINDSIYRDPRFFELSSKLGSMFAALGALAVAWDLAQRFYLKTEDKNIPKDEWDKHSLSDAIIKSGLAKIENGSVRVAGRDKYCSHLVQKQIAGKIGGLAKSRNRKRELASDSTSKLVKASYSYSYSKKEEGEGSNQTQKPKPKDILDLWNQQCEKSKGLQPARGLSSSRLAAIARLVEEMPNQQDWVDYFSKVGKSKFLTGKVPGKNGGDPFRANLDFVLHQGNFLKIVEGFYSSVGRVGSSDLKELNLDNPIASGEVLECQS